MIYINSLRDLLKCFCKRLGKHVNHTNLDTCLGCLRAHPIPSKPQVLSFPASPFQIPKRKRFPPVLPSPAAYCRLQGWHQKMSSMDRAVSVCQTAPVDMSWGSHRLGHGTNLFFFHTRIKIHEVTDSSICPQNI